MAALGTAYVAMDEARPRRGDASLRRASTAGGRGAPSGGRDAPSLPVLVAGGRAGVRSDRTAPRCPRSGTVDAWLGVDVGSVSTNVVLIDAASRVLARRYLMTAGRPLEAVREGLRLVGREVGDRVDRAWRGRDGSGRYLTGDFIGADVVRNEITAQARAAVSRSIPTSTRCSRSAGRTASSSGCSTVR